MAKTEHLTPDERRRLRTVMENGVERDLDAQLPPMVVLRLLDQVEELERERGPMARELHRLQHGKDETIESDYICDAMIEATNLRQELDRLRKAARLVEASALDEAKIGGDYVRVAPSYLLRLRAALEEKP